jgi:hypothetical protein
MPLFNKGSCAVVTNRESVFATLNIFNLFPLIRHRSHRKSSRCLATIRGIHRHTHRQQRDLISLLYFFKIRKVGL